MSRKGRALQEKRIVIAISGPKGLYKEAEFPSSVYGNAWI